MVILQRIYLSTTVTRISTLLQRSALSKLVAAAPVALLLASPMASQAAYSTNPLAPTVLSGSPTITMSGSVVTDTSQGHTAVGGVSSNSNYVTFTVPQGFVFQGLSLKSYKSADNRAFVALMPGNTWTSVPNVGTGALPGALAFHHFGTGGNPLGALCAQQYLSGSRTPSSGENCLTNPAGQSNLLTKSISTPINGTLPAGDYTVWIQQTSGELVDYVFEASFAPAPGPLPLLGAAAGWSLSRRLRKRIKGGEAAA